MSPATQGVLNGTENIKIEGGGLPNPLQRFRKDIERNQFTRKQTHNHVLYHENAVGLFPIKPGARESGADLVVNDISDKGHDHRPKHSHRIESKEESQHHSNDQTDGSDEKLWSHTADINELHHTDRAQQIITELPGSNELRQFEIVIAPADLTKKEADQGILHHVSVSHAGDFVHAPDFEKGIPKHPLNGGRNYCGPQDLEKKFDAIRGRIFKSVF